MFGLLQARFGEFVCVTVAHFFDPAPFKGFVYPSLKISVPHSEKIIASKRTARPDIMLRKNIEDLACYFLIRRHFSHSVISF
jgi:hypothetical protein